MSSLMTIWLVATAVFWDGGTLSGIGVLTSRPPRLTLQDANAPKQTNESSEEIVVDCRGVIQRRTIGLTEKELVVAEIDLPSLEGGKKYRLNITLVNPHEDPIQFSGISVSCGCAKFVADSKEIPALGSASFVMHLEVPNQIPMGRGSQAAKFSGVDPSQDVLMLRIEYDVNNVFAFVHDRVAVDIPKTESVVIAKLPVRLVPPMTLDKLELHVSENLNDLTIQLIGDDASLDLPYVKVEAARLAIPRHGILGDVILRRPGTSQESKVLVNITHQDLFTLRPESLRLTRDNQSKPYEATAMLRVHVPVVRDVEAESEVDQSDGEAKKEEKVEITTPPKIGLTIGGETARVLVKQLGESGIYRLTIHYDGLLDPKRDDTVEVRWRILVSGEERVIDSQAFFSNR